MLPVRSLHCVFPNCTTCASGWTSPAALLRYQRHIQPSSCSRCCARQGLRVVNRGSVPVLSLVRRHRLCQGHKRLVFQDRYRMIAKHSAFNVDEYKLAVRRCKLANLLSPLPDVLNAPSPVHPTPTELWLKLFIVNSRLAASSRRLGTLMLSPLPLPTQRPCESFRFAVPL